MLPPDQQDLTNEWEWLSRGSPLFIPSTVNPNLPILLADNYRNLLIFQNNSTATASGDVAANLLIAVDGPVITQQVTAGANVTLFPVNGITLVPGESLLLDQRILNNAIYVLWGNSFNTSGTVALGGMCLYGRTPNSPPEPVRHGASDVQLGVSPSTGIGPEVPNPFTAVGMAGYGPRRGR